MPIEEKRESSLADQWYSYFSEVVVAGTCKSFEEAYHAFFAGAQSVVGLVGTQAVTLESVMGEFRRFHQRIQSYRAFQSVPHLKFIVKGACPISHGLKEAEEKVKEPFEIEVIDMAAMLALTGAQPSSAEDEMYCPGAKYFVATASSLCAMGERGFHSFLTTAEAREANLSGPEFAYLSVCEHMGEVVTA